MEARRTLGLAGVVVLASLGASVALGPAATAAPAPHTWVVQAGEESPDHAIQGMAFLPTDIYIDAGDTVTWQANSAEPHTVTFLADQSATQPPEFTLPADLFPTGGPIYQPGTYFNSGVIDEMSPGFPYFTSYSLTFPAVGAFTYFCLVHGSMMKGTVHVATAGTAYPYSQRDYDVQARKNAAAIVNDGHRLAAATLKSVNMHNVAMGADDGVAMVMRFIRPTVTVHVGDTVTFANSSFAPHTVTFGSEPANPYAVIGDPTNYSGGDLSSGVVTPDHPYHVTFTKTGTYHYICVFHDYMGMVGTVNVES